MPSIRRLAVPFALLLVASCAGDRVEGLAPAPMGSGPQVIFEPLREPDAEVPFPSDMATRPVGSTVTGRLLNLSTASPLHAERSLRQKLNRLDGFSVSGPITLSFDAPLDLATVTDDSVLLIDVSPGSPDFGRRVPLDLGRGAFPAERQPRQMFPFDTFGDLPDVLFGRDNEVDGERVYQWEVATNTLIIRPLFPLRAATRYAVVLTRAVHGLGGEPVRSPFSAVNPANQTDALAPLADFVGGGLPEIAFTWAFTTQSITDEIVALREGLDGRGAFAWLRERYPGRITRVVDLGVVGDGDGSQEGVPADPRDHPFILQGEFLAKVLGPLAGTGFGVDTLDFGQVDYFVFGRIEMPDYRDEEGTIHADLLRGEIANRPVEIPFVLAVPQTTEKHKPPFPVVLYNHGARTSRMELVAIAGDFARHGFATISIDAAGHGPIGGVLRTVLPREGAKIPPALLKGLLGTIGRMLTGGAFSTDGKTVDQIFDELETIGLWTEIFATGRSVDRDGDGVILSGDGYFLPSVFELSSAVRQTLLDILMLYRVVHRLDPDAVPSAVDDPLKASFPRMQAHFVAGDFNLDGVLDAGGPGNRYFVAGTSLGGIHTSMVMALEPGLKTGVPIVSGGGFVDLLTRSNLEDTVDPVLAEALGPILVGCPAVGDDGAPYASLSWDIQSLRCRDRITVALAEMDQVPVVPGGVVELRNARLLAEGGEPYREDAIHTNPIGPDGRFHVAVAADEGDVLDLLLRDPFGEVVHQSQVVAPHDGLGRIRNTPRFRRLMGVAQAALDRADPLAYARYLIREPLPGSEPRNVLHLADIGDRTVPFASMVAWDRAVGLLGDDATAVDLTWAFVAHEALNGRKPYWDIDDLQGTGVGLGPRTPIATSSGVSSVRFAATGNHTYIATKNPDADFDWASYSRNQMIWFFKTGGAEIRDDLCLEDGSCPWLNDE